MFTCTGLCDAVIINPIVAAEEHYVRAMYNAMSKNLALPLVNFDLIAAKIPTLKITLSNKSALHEKINQLFL